MFVSFLEKTNQETGKLERVPFLKGYVVFNVAQCDGLKLKGDKPETVNPDAREALADEFMQATGADLRHGEGRAYFRPVGDYIMLPVFESFESADAYYETSFHELTHWTGAEPCLNRAFGKRFGDESYSAEELVAELGAAFMCAEFGFDSAQRDAAYISHWIRFLENHDHAIVTAASMASKAVEFLRNRVIAESEPMMQAA